MTHLALPLALTGDTFAVNARPIVRMLFCVALLAGGLRVAVGAFGRHAAVEDGFTDEMVITDAAGEDRTVRGLFAALSYDDGETWKVCRPITDDGPGRTVGTVNGEPFTMSWEKGEPKSYLAVCQARNDVIHLVGSRQHYAFNLAWLETAPPAGPKSNER